MFKILIDEIVYSLMSLENFEEVFTF